LLIPGDAAGFSVVCTNRPLAASSTSHAVFRRSLSTAPGLVAVMTHFIEAGLREAIERGYIRLEDDE
jgi:hypothetical protein